MGGKAEKTHVVEEGPKRGLSWRGWKESLPRNLATQASFKLGLSLGQLLMYMTTTKTATLATTNIGINHEVHSLSEASTSKFSRLYLPFFAPPRSISELAILLFQSHNKSLCFFFFWVMWVCELNTIIRKFESFSLFRDTEAVYLYYGDT